MAACPICGAAKGACVGPHGPQTINYKPIGSEWAGKGGDTMAEQVWTSHWRLYRDANGKAVEANDPTRVALLVNTGGTLPMDEAVALGLTEPNLERSLTTEQQEERDVERYFPGNVRGRRSNDLRAEDGTPADETPNGEGGGEGDGERAETMREAGEGEPPAGGKPRTPEAARPKAPQMGQAETAAAAAAATTPATNATEGSGVSEVDLSRLIVGKEGTRAEGLVRDPGKAWREPTDAERAALAGAAGETAEDGTDEGPDGDSNAPGQAPK